ncbi:MAG TPA: hypothetical protein VKU00_24165 [Chthonomonadaceae bacterium]|nr:hypothetical protein [Chthonomonadaceae bacterium]
MYNASGDATDVTVAYSYHKQHVYDPYGNVIGVDYKEGHIYDPIDNVIGYITQNDPITVLQNTESGHIFDGGTRWIG